MALTVETGAGVQSADAYASRAFVDAYWTARPHSEFASPWESGDDDEKDGAIREATSYLDAIYGPYYIGQRRGRLQGLLWPRTNAFDVGGYPLPDLPDELKKAVAELAGRIIANEEALAPDLDPTQLVTKEKKQIGPILKELEYANATSVGGANANKRYGFVEGLMAGLVTNGAAGAWAWA